MSVASPCIVTSRIFPSVATTRIAPLMKRSTAGVAALPLSNTSVFDNTVSVWSAGTVTSLVTRMMPLQVVLVPGKVPPTSVIAGLVSAMTARFVCSPAAETIKLNSPPPSKRTSVLPSPFHNRTRFVERVTPGGSTLSVASASHKLRSR